MTKEEIFGVRKINFEFWLGTYFKRTFYLTGKFLYEYSKENIQENNTVK